MHMAKVDIFVPCYNYGRFLPACVGSILGQSIADLRVLIIDDASSDDTHAVATRLAEADPRVAIISHEHNWGHIRTYNEGIEWACAEYVMLLSADDLLAPSALERATAILDAHPDVVLTHGDCIDWMDDLPFPEINSKRGYTWTRQDLIRESCAAGKNLVKTPTVIARTSVQKAVGGYRPNLPHTGDMEMWLRLAANGSVARIHSVQAVYRLHSTNMSHSYCRDYCQLKDAFDSFFAEYADRFSDSRSLRQQADHAVAETAFWTGMAELSRGRFDSGRRLLRFAIDLRPRLRYWPPVARLLKTPDLNKRAASALAGGLTRWRA